VADDDVVLPELELAGPARLALTVEHGGRIAFRANDPEALVGAATAGLGLCAVPCLLGDLDPALARVETLGFARCDLFLVTHTETSKTPRVRAVTDFIAALVEKNRAAIQG